MSMGVVMVYTKLHKWSPEVKKGDIKDVFLFRDRVLLPYIEVIANDSEEGIVSELRRKGYVVLGIYGLEGLLPECECRYCDPPLHRCLRHRTLYEWCLKWTSAVTSRLEISWSTLNDWWVFARVPSYVGGCWELEFTPKEVTITRPCGITFKYRITSRSRVRSYFIALVRLFMELRLLEELLKSEDDC